jgi:hypothetical protein
MTALPGMPSTPADVWSGDGVWHVSAIARLLVPEQRPRPEPAPRRRPTVRVPRPRTAPDVQRRASTPAGKAPLPTTR